VEYNESYDNIGLKMFDSGEGIFLIECFFEKKMEYLEQIGCDASFRWSDFVPRWIVNLRILPDPIRDAEIAFELKEAANEALVSRFCQDLNEEPTESLSAGDRELVDSSVDDAIVHPDPRSGFLVTESRVMCGSNR
jgi:hypothetical protein